MGEWNLSYQSLRSHNMQTRLRELRDRKDPFWDELSRENPCHQRPVTAAVVAEDIMADPDDVEDLDDTAVSLKDVINATHKEPAPTKKTRRVGLRGNGGLMVVAAAEQLNNSDAVDAKGADEKEAGRGKRKKTANRLYNLTDFARHWDDNGSDVE